MHRLLFLSFFFLSPSISYAKTQTVIAQGYGKTQEIAIEQAKRNAVEVVTGAWISSEESLEDNKFSSKTSSFTTGVIESYQILQATSSYVEIRATVVDRKDEELQVANNTLTLEEQGEIKQLRKNTSELEASLEELDNVTRSLEFLVTNLKVEKTGREITITGHLKFKDKWKAQYKGLVQKAGEKKALIHASKCEYEVNGKLIFTSKRKKVVLVEEVLLQIPHREFIDRELRPELGFNQEYIFNRVIPEEFEKVELEVYCEK